MHDACHRRDHPSFPEHKLDSRQEVVFASMRGSFSSLDALKIHLCLVLNRSNLDWRSPDGDFESAASYGFWSVTRSPGYIKRIDVVFRSGSFNHKPFLIHIHWKVSLRIKTLKWKLSTHSQGCKITRFPRVTTHFVSKRLIKSSHNDGMN